MPKISALPNQTAPDGADELPMNDVSATTTKKMTLTIFKQWFQAITDFVKSTMIDWSTMTGWQTETATCTYASATTFTVAGDQRTRYSKGTRIKLVQGANTKYGTVISSAYSTSTTVTLAPNSDYSIANAAIDAMYYSYQASPQGYPTYFNFTVTPTCPSGTAPTYSTSQGTFSVNGGTVVVQYYLSNSTGGTAGASANPLYLNTPIRPSTATRSGFGAAYNGGTAINGFVIYDVLAVTEPSNDKFYMGLRAYNITGADQNNANRYLQLTLTYTMV